MQRARRSCRGALPPTAAMRAVVRSYFPPRAGDVVAIQAPFSFWGKYGEKDQGGSHGSFYRYDTDVPLYFYGSAFKPGHYGQAEMVDLAATLARLLGVSLPAACEGQPLVERWSGPGAAAPATVPVRPLRTPRRSD